MSFKKHLGLPLRCIYTEVPGVGLQRKPEKTRQPETLLSFWGLGAEEGERELTSHCVQPQGGICTSKVMIKLLPV